MSTCLSEILNIDYFDELVQIVQLSVEVTNVHQQLVLLLGIIYIKSKQLLLESIHYKERVTIFINKTCTLLMAF